MGFLSVRLVLLLAVAVVAWVFTYRLALKQEVVGRKHVVGSSAVFLLGMLGLIPAVRDRIKALPVLQGDSLAYTMALSVVICGILFGLALTGRRRLALMVRETLERFRIALEERRDPELRKRNICMRKYKRVLQVLHDDDPTHSIGRTPWQHDEMVRSVIGNLTDEDIQILSEFLNLHLLAGKSPPDVFDFFLKGERKRASREGNDMRGHLVRLTTVTGRLRQENAA